MRYFNSLRRIIEKLPVNKAHIQFHPVGVIEGTRIRANKPIKALECERRPPIFSSAWT